MRPAHCNEMSARPFLLCVLLVASQHAASECECLWQGSFVDVQASTDLVVSGTVGSTRGNSIDLEVERVLRGADDVEHIRVWMKAADYCRPEVDRFPVGSSWVMALHSIDEQVAGGFNPATPNISYGRVGDYRLSNCGGFWLSRTQDVVTGNLVDAPRWDYTPGMTPVRLDLLAAHMRGEVPRANVAAAAREDPALRELMLDTRSFLRDQ
jgi:hypothetical protein